MLFPEAERLQPQNPVVEKNLETVGKHFESELAGDSSDVVTTYTDDIVWESPYHPNGEVHRGKSDVKSNYDWILEHVRLVDYRNLDRFATEDRVVDDGIVMGEVKKDGFLPFPVGTRVSLRILHVFDMRGGLISKERGFVFPKPA